MVQPTAHHAATMSGAAMDMVEWPHIGRARGRRPRELRSQGSPRHPFIHSWGLRLNLISITLWFGPPPLPAAQPAAPDSQPQESKEHDRREELRSLQGGNVLVEGDLDGLVW